MIFAESDDGKWFKENVAEGQWHLNKETFEIKYHPKHKAQVECMVATCRKDDKVLGLIVQIRKISAKYKKEMYEFAIKTILSDTLLEKYFGIEELEIPF